MEYNTHSLPSSHHKAGIFSETGQKQDTASTGDIIVGPPISLRELGEIIIRAQGAAWLKEYAKSFDAAPAAAPYPTPADDGELVIEFFGRGLPS